MAPLDSPSAHPSDFDAKLAMLKKKKEMRVKNLDPIIRDPFEDEWEVTVSELKDLAEGKDFEGIGAKYYSEWTPEDFRDLLEELGEK